MWPCETPQKNRNLRVVWTKPPAWMYVCGTVWSTCLILYSISGTSHCQEPHIVRFPTTTQSTIVNPKVLRRKKTKLNMICRQFFTSRFHDFTKHAKSDASMAPQWSCPLAPRDIPRSPHTPPVPPNPWQLRNSGPTVVIFFVGSLVGWFSVFDSVSGVFRSHKNVVGRLRLG